MLSIVFNDLNYAIRLLAKKPGFTFLTTLVLAVGIGLSVFLFSYLNTMMFKDLPFKDGGSLVQIYSSEYGVRNGGYINYHDLNEIRSNVKGLAEFSAYRDASFNVSGLDSARRYTGVMVEHNIFQLTRTKPFLGRTFTEADNQVGAQNVVIIGHDAWKNQFAADPNILARMLVINGEQYKIVAVMPQGYYFPRSADLWIPLKIDLHRLPKSEVDSVRGIAHINEKVTFQDVNLELALITQRIEDRHPKVNSGVGAYIDTMQMSGVGDGIGVIYSMQIIAILILILASINAGNLLLSRMVERSKETAIRMALGAPRFRLISQMLWESLIICCAAGVIGFLLVIWGLEVTQAKSEFFLGEKPPYWWKFGMDVYTLKIFLAFIFFTIILTGFLPAWKNSGTDFNSVLRDGTRGSQGKKSSRLNQFLVISEIFISLTVLISAALMVVGSYSAIHADNGANTENVLTAEILLPDSKYKTGDEQTLIVKNIQSLLENSIGIDDVMFSSALPGEWASRRSIALEGNEYAELKNYPIANYIKVFPGSLRKLGVELKLGRYFLGSDDSNNKRYAIVTDSFAARHFPQDSAIGKRIRLIDTVNESEGEVPTIWITIIGVVEHTIQADAYDVSAKIPSVFVPFSHDPGNEISIAMKIKSNPSVAIRSLRNVLESVDPELPAFRVYTYKEKISRGMAAMKFFSTVFLLFGIAAVVLAASGIYGVMSNTVNQRIQEMGMKRALGALDQRIVREFLAKGFKQLLLGGIPGLIVGCGMGFAMSKMLVSGNADLAIIAFVMVTIVSSVVLLACYIPTKRALQMEPAAALRYE